MKHLRLGVRSRRRRSIPHAALLPSWERDLSRVCCRRLSHTRRTVIARLLPWTCKLRAKVSPHIQSLRSWTNSTGSKLTSLGSVTGIVALCVRVVAFISGTGKEPARVVMSNDAAIDTSGKYATDGKADQTGQLRRRICRLWRHKHCIAYVAENIRTYTL